MQIERLFIVLLLGCFSFTNSQTSVAKSSFYEALSSQNIKTIDDELNRLQKNGSPEAFSGALLMKKSGFSSNPKDRLNLFKKGHADLETAIKKDSSNCEFRLLRLMIQENSPKILQYHGEIKKDASYLRKNYEHLPAGLKKVILDYSKNSKELRPEDFNGKAHG